MSSQQPRQRATASRPLVSVLIASHNYTEFLPRAVESVVAQTHPTIELVIIDDGSTDGSWDYIRSIPSRHGKRFARFHCHRLPTNQGKLAALNVGIPLLQGELTVILDADDALLPDYVATTLAHYESASSTERNVGFVYTDCHLINRHDRWVGRGRSAPFDADLLQTRSYVPECALTVTEALKATLPLDESIRVGTKHHKWRRLIEPGYRGVYVPQPLFRYRMHDRNISGIGTRVLDDVRHGRARERILSAYWVAA